MKNDVLAKNALYGASKALVITNFGNNLDIVLQFSFS